MSPTELNIAIIAAMNKYPRALTANRLPGSRGTKRGTLSLCKDPDANEQRLRLVTELLGVFPHPVRLARKLGIGPKTVHDIHRRGAAAQTGGV